MIAVDQQRMLPSEGWERVRDRLRAGILARLSRDPGRLVWLAQAQVWGLWAALVLLLVVVAVFPRYRQSLGVFLSCYWILIL